MRAKQSKIVESIMNKTSIYCETKDLTKKTDDVKHFDAMFYDVDELMINVKVNGCFIDETVQHNILNRLSVILNQYARQDIAKCDHKVYAINMLSNAIASINAYMTM